MLRTDPVLFHIKLLRILVVRVLRVACKCAIGRDSLRAMLTILYFLTIDWYITKSKAMSEHSNRWYIRAVD